MWRTAGGRNNRLTTADHPKCFGGRLTPTPNRPMRGSGSGYGPSHCVCGACTVSWCRSCGRWPCLPGGGSSIAVYHFHPPATALPLAAGRPRVRTLPWKEAEMQWRACTLRSVLFPGSGVQVCGPTTNDGQEAWIAAGTRRLPPPFPSKLSADVIPCVFRGARALCKPCGRRWVS